MYLCEVGFMIFCRFGFWVSCVCGSVVNCMVCRDSCSFFDRFVTAIGFHIDMDGSRMAWRKKYQQGHGIAVKRSVFITTWQV